MKRVCLLIGLFSLVFVTACEKQPERIEDYFLEFATVLKSNGEIKFALDNRKILIPKTSTSYDGINGQRVILDYTPYKADTVIVNRVTDIFTSTIAKTDFRYDGALIR